LACAVPFLGADVGGNRLLASCGAGWLFEQGSVSALAALLQKAFNERSELRAHGCAASSQIRNHYNWARSAEVLESIFTSRLGVRSSLCMPRQETPVRAVAFRH
jgi:glycosyltransferase involved in cell wall biosynthesis